VQYSQHFAAAHPLPQFGVNFSQTPGHGSADTRDSLLIHLDACRHADRVGHFALPHG
jgi:hypothetical protein